MSKIIQCKKGEETQEPKGQSLSGVSLRILVAGERCNITGEYFEKGSTSEWKVVIGYQTLAGELSLVNREFSHLWCLMKTLAYPGFLSTKHA